MAKEKKEKKERTYSPKGIISEIRAVKWPTAKELFSNSGRVIIFTLLFGLYFFICELAASGLINWIVGA
jgi:preprotein translocase subunit SecE